MIGLPVVLTLHNGIPKGVLDGKSGFIVPKRRDALAERLSYLIENSEIWADMGRYGRVYVEERYNNIEQVNQELIKMYEKLQKVSVCLY